MSNLFNSAQFDETDDILIEEDGTVVDEVPANTGDDQPGNTQTIVDELQDDLIEVELQEGATAGDSQENINNDLDIPPSNVKSGSSSVIVPFASALQEKGILNQENIDRINESANQTEELFEIMAENNDKTVDNWVETLPDNLKFVISNYKEGIPLDKLIQAQSEVTSVASLTEDAIVDSEDNQIAVYKEFYKEKGLSDAKLSTDFKRAKELGLLSDDSIDMHKELIQIKEAKKNSLIEAEKIRLKKDDDKRIETLDKIKDTVSNLKSIIPGVDINKSVRDSVYKNMTMPYKDGKSYAQVKREEDPIAFEMRLNYFIEKGFFNKDADFKTLVGAAKTRATKEFEKSIERNGSGLTNNTMSAKGMHSTPEEDSVDWKTGLSGF